MASLALSDSFEYLCYGSTDIRNIFTLYSAEIDLVSESDVYRRQIMMTKVDLRTVKDKPS